MPLFSSRRGSAASTVLVLVVLGLLPCCGGGGTAGTAPVVFFSLESGAIGAWSSIVAPHVPGLVKFDLAFTNGDHHVSTISAGGVSSGGTGPDLGSFLLMFQDGGGPDDPVAMSAKYVDLSGGSARQVTFGQDLTGTAQLPLPSIGPTEIFVLSGFSIETDGSDHQIRTLRITPFPDLGYVEVEYRDDSPGDDLYAATVVFAVVPIGGVPGSYVYTGPFDAALSFAGSGTTTREIGAAVIHGFSLIFLSGNRNLERVSIDLDSTNLIRATFRDGSVHATDDLVLANVSYVLVNPGAPPIR